MTTPPTIVFVSAVCPAQYSLLCSYLRQTGLAQSWYMTTPGNAQKFANTYDHLLPFKPDGKIVGPQSYYYTSKLERSARIGRGVLKAIQAFEKKQPIDLIVAHSLWGAPHFLYDETDAAIVSYIEFPSYRAHGWDAAYPPDQAQRMGDRNMEMLHFHQVLNSDLTIVPSQHARNLFPESLRSQIEVQFEGFDIAPLASSPQRQDQRFTIGFSARDLSSAKGLETYIRLVDRLVREGDGQHMRFVALGDPQATTYGYEQQWVERRYEGQFKSFRDHLLQQYPAAKQAIEFPGKLPYDVFSATLSSIDLFLYPLRYGVANWGLMEILARGGCVIGSNWGFVPELIRHDVNGMLMPDSDDAWLGAIRQLRDDPARRARYAAAARQTGEAFHISKIAPRYMRLFELAMVKRQTRAMQSMHNRLIP
ncbi:glycosyltransferase [Lampropedia puyangensis]|uniref:Glycosyltransferase n=1 Tax=Lampropedia puyangensis TaxID=1330072 RepID=A0A4S8EYF9_9BURK|nr:glycosyltransferase [Lampropedia puyangensis]THT99957.1 glycosyltransferase [Lampropedia puyangensis]